MARPSVTEHPEPPASEAGEPGRLPRRRPIRARLRRLVEAVGLAPSAPGDDHYHGFISYSHAVDGQLAPALQQGLQRFAKPWYRTRALHVFRDEAVLSANPRLWTSIRQALDRSQFFILLASPKAAESHWVAREAQTWREHKPPENLLLGLTDGELVWDDDAQDFDWEATTAVPDTLRGAFSEEPRFIDLRWAHHDQQLSLSHPRFRNAVAELAAPLHGVPKDELASEEVRQHRRAVRLARGAVATLVSLLVVAVVASVLALTQRSTALREARVAASRQLAATSETELSGNVRVALLLAVQAYRKDANPQSRSALLRADTASPRLVRYVPLPGRVAQLVGGAGGFTVAGLPDGRVLRLDLTHPRATPLLKLGSAIASLAISRDGSVAAAADGSSAMVWRQGRSPLTLQVPAGQRPDTVAVSPSGSTVLVHGATGRFESFGSITAVDVATGAVRSVHRDPIGVTSLTLPSDERVLLFTSGSGSWEWRQLRDWSREGASSPALGIHEMASFPSSDGSRFTATNGLSTIPVWRTRGRNDHDRPGLTAQAPIANPTAIALSPDGQRLAVADSGTVYEAPVARQGASRDPAVALTGNGSIDPGGLAFAGDGSHLMAAAGDEVAVWNLDQLDRLARVSRTPVPSACTACPGANIEISPRGSPAVIADSSGTQAVIQPLGGRPGQPVTLRSANFDYSFDTPLWRGDRLVLPVTPLSSSTSFAPPAGLPAGARFWTAASKDQPVAVGLSRDRRSVYVVDFNGRVYTQDANTGAVRSTRPPPPGIPHDNSRPWVAAVSGDLVARAFKGSVAISELPTGHVVGRIGGPDIAYLAFAGDRLLVQRESGVLEVWRDHGHSRGPALGGDDDYRFAPVANTQATLVARHRSDGSTVIQDLRAGTVLGALPSPGVGALKTGIGFAPNGSSLVTLTDNPGVGPATLVQRDLSYDALVRAACRAAGRDLTASEWRTFVGTSPPADLSCR